MPPGVERAIAQLQAALGGDNVIVDPTEGGADVIVEHIDLVAGTYHQKETWVGFRLTNAYPQGDVYPHYVRGDITRTNGHPHGDGIQTGHVFMERPALQLSRRGWNPADDTALRKLRRVIQWFDNHP